MAKILDAVNLTGMIAPLDDADTYGTHNEIYGIGGYRAVADQPERDAITAQRRKAGMMVFQQDTAEVYRLESDLVSWTLIQLSSQTSDVTFNDLVVSGNLTVQGTTTTLNTATLDVEDNNITLNYGAGDTSASADGSGITIQDAIDASTDATMLWDATNNRFVFSHDVQANIVGQVTDISNHTTADLAEDPLATVSSGTMYYTDARAQNAISTDATLSYSAGEVSMPATGVTAGSYGSASEVPVFTVDAQGRLTSATTTTVAGVSNFTWTSGTATLEIDTADGSNFPVTIDIASFDTGDLTEGTNLYYTDSRARNSISVTGDLTYTPATGVLGVTTYKSADFDTDFSGKTTDDLTEGTNLYYTEARVDANIAGKTTDDLTEGTNLYYTNARVRAAISAVDAGGDGSFSYDSGTGAFTYTGPSATEVRAHFSGGTGVDIINGVVSIGQPVATTDNVTFNDVTVDGNLVVNGTTTTLNTATLDVEDKNITLNAGAGDTSASADGAGITVQDGVNGATDATILWDATNDRWVFSHAIEADIIGNITGGTNGDVTGDIYADNGTSKILENGTDGTDASLTLGNGVLSWNATDGAVDINYGTVSLQVGQEEHYYAKANEAISNGDVVMFAGAQGDHVLIAKCDVTAPGFEPTWIMGVATQDFAINEFGYVTTFGKVRDLDTSLLSEGDILYVDPAVVGGVTTTKPTPPNHIIQIAAVLRSHANAGTLLVRLTHQPDTDETPEGVTNLYYTDDRVYAALASGTTDLDNRYHNTTLDTTDDVLEGSTNLYYTDARARASISAGKGLSYDSGTGVVSANNSVYVASTEPMDWVVGDVWIETE